MILETSRKFDSMIFEIRDSVLKKRLLRVIEQMEKAKTLRDIKNIKAIVGYHNFFRIKIGRYRLGFSLKNNVIRLLYFGKRDDNTYKQFP